MVSLIIIFVGVIIGRVMGRVADHVFKYVGADKLFQRALNLQIPIQEFGGMVLAYIIYSIFIVIALIRLGITGRVVLWFFFGVVIFVFLTLFLRLQDAVFNLIAGWELRHHKTLKKGDWVRMYATKVQIQKIGLMHVVALTKKGDILYIPSSLKLEHVK